MNNLEIIANAAVASGYFTEDEVLNLLEEGEDIPFHTYSVWKKRFGMVPMRGSTGWPCKIWRRKDRKSDIDEKEATDEDREKSFYLTNSFFFHISQVEKIKERDSNE